MKAIVSLNKRRQSDMIPYGISLYSVFSFFDGILFRENYVHQDGENSNP